jgi:glycosyltransferase involved in cell wall biosynthesis
MTGARQPITIHQFHFTATAGDAVTNHMILIRAALAEAGIAGSIFVGENRAPKSYNIQTFMPAKMWNSDLVLVHHSHGNPLLGALFKIDIPRALIYHNVTPASYFSHDPFMAQFSRKGRDELRAFHGNCVSAFGVSRFNCAELEVLGFERPQVFPLLDLSAPFSPQAVSGKRLDSSARTLLFVGKQTPHKNQALLLQTLYYLQKNDPGKYRLVLAGRADPIYGQYLQLLAKALGVAAAVKFTGPLSQSHLEGLYAQAAALICPSLHEGFCVPVVEAMQRQLPVFALPTTGLRETLGRAGVRLVSRQPHKVAEAIDTVLSDSAAVEAIVLGQESRLSELAQIHNRQRIQNLCISLVDQLRHFKPGQPFKEISP